MAHALAVKNGSHPIVVSALLAFTAGFVDTVGFIALFGLFTAHVTGNFVLIGAALIDSHEGLVSKLLALPLFVLAVAATRLFILARERRAHDATVPVLVGQLAFQGLFLACGLWLAPFDHADAPATILTGMSAVVAMAIQNVINDDTVGPGGGFPPHGHRDMEIISYVVQGGLAHRDSTGGEGVLRRGDVQAMSAGTGVRHSEFNASDEAPVRFLQIWVIPELQGLPAAYRQTHVSDDDKRNRLRLIVAPEASAAAPSHTGMKTRCSSIPLAPGPRPAGIPFRTYGR